MWAWMYEADRTGEMNSRVDKEKKVVNFNSGVCPYKRNVMLLWEAAMISLINFAGARSACTIQTSPVIRRR